MSLFLNPWMLWGLLGISVPIIIHLLNRFQRRRIDWAAMDLLKRALVMRSRQIQIEDLLLLALRCLAIALLVLAMARPRTQDSPMPWFRPGQQVATVILMDGSFSMAHNPGVNSRFERTRQTVREIQNTLHDGHPVSLVLMGNRPRILLRNLAYNEPRFNNALEEAAPLPEGLDLELALEQAAALLEEAKGSVRECYLLTDAQAITWGNLSEKARLLLNQIGTQANLFFLSAGEEASANLALTDFSISSGALRQNASARYLATVRNSGPRAAENVAVTLLQNDRAVDRRVIERIEPNGIGMIPLFVRFEQSGNVPLAAMLDRDDLLFDNTRYAVAAVRERVRVLCVDGAPSSRPFENGTAYLETALAPGRSRGAGASVAVESVSWLQFSGAQLNEVDVVFLANVPDLRPEQLSPLESFVRQGGALAVFLGGKINPRMLNERLAASSAGLLPAEIAERVTAPEDLNWSIEPAAAGHRLTRLFRALPPDLMAEIQLAEHFKLNPLPGSQIILQVSGTAEPLFLEKRLGEGLVLLFGGSADRAWSNFPMHPVFPILIQEMLNYATAGAHENALLVGDALAVPLAPQGVEASVVLHTPAGVEIPVQVTKRQGRRVAEHDQVELPGFYELRESNGSILVAVNVDPAESDVRMLPGEDVPRALAGLRMRFLSEGEDLAAAIRESRIGREWWRVLLIAGLAVLALEMFLAWFFSRRIRMTEQSPAGRRGTLFSRNEPAPATTELSAAGGRN